MTGPHRRIEGGDRFSHNTVAILTAFATSVMCLHDAIHENEGCWPGDTSWEIRAGEWAQSAVRAARMLTVREEYK